MTMNPLRLGLRLLGILWLALLTWLAYLGWRLRSPRADRAELRGRALARLFERLGATFVKFGQILSTRPDLLNPATTTALAKLQDDVAPAPFAELEPLLRAELGAAGSRLVVEPTPLAAASVAQVHRALLDGATPVAVKLQRPKARAQIERDLALLGLGARLLDKLPTMHLLSLPGAVREFGVALHAQLDFRAEARNNRRFAENFAAVPGVRVPALHAELCTERVLVMEFIEGVKATEPEKVDGDRAELARRGGAAILKMVFTDAFVHADLHPGNILLTRGGDFVLIDLGLVAEFPPDLVRPWVETFVALAAQRGEDAARLFYIHAPTVATRDYGSFERDVCAQLQNLYGKSIGEVEVGQAVSGMMNVLRRHRVQINPVFTVAHLAMLVAEGLGKQLDPTLDMMTIAGPYLGEALVKAPPGRAPYREIPAEFLAAAAQ